MRGVQKRKGQALHEKTLRYFCEKDIKGKEKHNTCVQLHLHGKIIILLQAVIGTLIQLIETALQTKKIQHNIYLQQCHEHPQFYVLVGEETR